MHLKYGVISISNYHEFTEVAAVDPFEKELNDSLISVLNKVTTYEIISDTLHFQGKSCEVKFNKE